MLKNKHDSNGRRWALPLAALGCFVFVGCDDDVSVNRIADASVDARSGIDAASPDASVGDAAPTTFQVTLENISKTPPFPSSGKFAVPEGAAMPGPLTPGQSYKFTFEAAPGYPARMGKTSLTFATMFVPSNIRFNLSCPAAAGEERRHRVALPCA